MGRSPRCGAHYERSQCAICRVGQNTTWLVREEICQRSETVISAPHSTMSLIYESCTFSRVSRASQKIVFPPDAIYLQAFTATLARHANYTTGFCWNQTHLLCLSQQENSGQAPQLTSKRYSTQPHSLNKQEVLNIAAFT